MKRYITSDTTETQLTLGKHGSEMHGSTYMQINPHVVQGSTLPSITRDYYEQLYANKMDNLENG